MTKLWTFLLRHNFQASHSYGVEASESHSSDYLYNCLYLTQRPNSDWLWQVMWHKNYLWHHSTLSTRPWFNKFSHISKGIMASTSELPTWALKIIMWYYQKQQNQSLKACKTFSKIFKILNSENHSMLRANLLPLDSIFRKRKSAIGNRVNK